MSSTDNASRTSDEKLMGAVAHMFGPLVSIIIWATQKDKSRFVKFQALQSLVFDLIVATLTGLFLFCIFGISFLGIFGAMFNTLDSAPPSEWIPSFILFPMMFPFTIFACVFPISFILLIIRLIASISILNGRNYYYPLIGKWLDNFLEN